MNRFMDNVQSSSNLYQIKKENRIFSGEIQNTNNPLPVLVPQGDKYFIDGQRKQFEKKSNAKPTNNPWQMPAAEDDWIWGNKKLFPTSPTQIQQDNLMVFPDDVYNPESTGYRNKQFDRNLVTKDIDGAVPDTLKSKAQKNKLKFLQIQEQRKIAQSQLEQEIQKRKDQEKLQSSQTKFKETRQSKMNYHRPIDFQSRNMEIQIDNQLSQSENKDDDYKNNSNLQEYNDENQNPNQQNNQFQQKNQPYLQQDASKSVQFRNQQNGQYDQLDQHMQDEQNKLRNDESSDYLNYQLKQQNYRYNPTNHYASMNQLAQYQPVLINQKLRKQPVYNVYQEANSSESQENFYNMQKNQQQQQMQQSFQNNNDFGVYRYGSGIRNLYSGNLRIVKSTNDFQNLKHGYNFSNNGYNLISNRYPVL